MKQKTLAIPIRLTDYSNSSQIVSLLTPDVGALDGLAKGASDIFLTFDGQAGLEIDERDTIVVRRDEHPVNMIVLPEHTYYDVLKTKLRWSGGRV